VVEGADPEHVHRRFASHSSTSVGRSSR
jgi:hypothetical protein